MRIPDHLRLEFWTLVVGLILLAVVVWCHHDGRPRRPPPWGNYDLNGTRIP